MKKVFALVLALALCLSLLPTAFAAERVYEEAGYTVERRLEASDCAVVLRWRPLATENDIRDYELWLVYPDGEGKKLLLPSTVISEQDLSFAPTDRAPDLMTLDSIGSTLTYVYRFGDKLVSPYYGTTLHEAGTYTYTVELATGNLSAIYSEPLVPAEEAEFSDVPAGSWFEKGVMTCAGKGIMVGTGEGLFSPDTALTNAECLTLALRLYDLRQGGSGQLFKAPEEWGRITLTLETGEQISGYYGRFYVGWYRFSTSTASHPNPKILLDLKTDEEREWAETQSGKAATLTAGGASTSGTVELSWLPTGGSALFFLPGDGSDPRGAFNASQYCSNLYPGTDQWWRDAAYTLNLVQDEARAREDYTFFSGLSWAMTDYTAKSQPATRTIFAGALAETAGELRPLYSVEALPDVQWNDWNGGIRALYEAGVLTGVDEYGRYYEGGSLTRAQAAVMVARVLDESQRVTTPPKALPTGGYALTELAEYHNGGAPLYPLCVCFSAEDEYIVLSLEGKQTVLPRNVSTSWQGGEYLYVRHFKEDSYEESPSLLDREGNVVVPPWQYMELNPTWDGTAIVAKRGLSGLESWYLLSPSGEQLEQLPASAEGSYYREFNEGVYPLKDPETGLYGYADKAGAWVLPPRWNMAFPFQKGYALVGTTIPGRDAWEYSYTLIDHQGVELFPAREFYTQSWLYNSPDYEDGYLYWFRDLDGKETYLNADGELVPAPKYCDEEKYQNGYFAQDGVYYDLTGTPVSQKFDWCGKLDAQGRGFVGLDDTIYRFELNP